MTLGVYRWGWFATAISRAIWGWASGKVSAGGFTPRAAVSATVMKAAPVIEKGVSVKESRRKMAARHAPSAVLVPNMNNPASTACTVSLPEGDPTPSRAGAKGQKRAGTGPKAVKLGRRPKSTGTAKVVNKTKKP